MHDREAWTIGFRRYQFRSAGGFSGSEELAMTRTFALVFGTIFLVVGILGFVPALVTPAHDAGLSVHAAHGYLFGLFPVNAMHNLVHIVIGIWGILGSRSLGGALVFSRGVAVIYGVLTVLGLFPATNTLFGLAPIHGHDVWLHAASALVAAYFGFFVPAAESNRRVGA
jgi:hypothetical protein